MKESGKIGNGIDQIGDKYLTEAMEYAEESSSSRKRGYVRWIAAAACICLLIGGGLLWKLQKPAGEPPAGKGTAQAGETLYVDARTLLSGKEGGIPIEIRSGMQTEEKEGDLPGGAAEKERVTVTWVYQAVSGQKVSQKTVNELNRKLKEDGYSFKVKFVALTDSNKELLGVKYREKVFESNADIAFTGFYSAGEQSVQEAVRAGKYEPLEGYLRESRSYDQIPELLWEGASYQNHVYFFPSEIAQDGGMTLYMRKSSFTKEEADAFDGDIFQLEKYLRQGKRILKDRDGFDFAETFGYAAYGGVLLTSEGKAVNPLEEEQCVRWLRLLNTYKKQVEGKSVSNWDFALTRSFPGTGIGEGNRPEDFYEYHWKGYVLPRLNCQTGILASSAHKEEAFCFLDLLHVDHSYAELLLYGKEYLDGKGESQCSYANQLVFGLDTGLVPNPKDYSLRHFMTAEEKKQYYEENLLPSPALKLRNPEVCDYALPAEAYYSRLIYDNDFDGLLEEARKKLKEPMEKVFRELK